MISTTTTSAQSREAFRREWNEVCARLRPYSEKLKTCYLVPSGWATPKKED